MRLAELRRLAILAALALLAACGSTPGPQPAELTVLDNPRPLRVLWSTSLNEDLRYTADWPPPIVEGGDRWVFFPVLVGDAIYATSREGVVVRLDAANGRRRWRTPAETPVSSGVGADADAVAVANEDGEVVAFDAGSGKVRWRARVSSEVLAPPEVGAGLVLVRSVDNRIFAFNASDGKRRWVYQRAAVNLIRPASPLAATARTPASRAASWSPSRCRTAASAGRRRSRCPRARPSSSASATSSAAPRCKGGAPRA